MAAARAKKSQGYEEARETFDDDDERDVVETLSAKARECLRSLLLEDDALKSAAAARLARAAEDIELERRVRIQARHERWEAMNKVITFHEPSDSKFGRELTESHRDVGEFESSEDGTVSSRSIRSRNDERLLPMDVWARPEGVLGGRMGQPGDKHVHRRHATPAVEVKMKQCGKAMVAHNRSTDMFALIGQRQRR